MIEIKIVIDKPIPDEDALSVVIDNIQDFVETQFPELKGHMNSPVRVSIKIVSENEKQEGEVL